VDVALSGANRREQRRDRSNGFDESSSGAPKRQAGNVDLVVAVWQQAAAMSE
jgi:hypothetical protein